jgi:limonene-1,2-epoxide hydrolase
LTDVRQRNPATRLLLALIVSLAAVSGAAADERQRASRSRRGQPAATVPADRERRVFTVSAGSALDVSNIAGEVRIAAGAADAIVVESERRGRTATDDLRLEMRQIGNRVVVRVTGARSNRNTSTIDITVTAPRDAAVAARSVSGHVTLTGLDGEARLETVSGNVDVTRASNVTLAKTVSGTVTVRGSASAGTMTLGTVSGSVVGADLKARGIEATTVSGTVQLERVDAQRVLAKSVSGGVEFAGPVAAAGTFEFTSHSGDVRLRLPARSSFDLSADTFSGHLTSDFPITLRSTRGSRGPAQTLRGVVGDGAAQLVVRSFSGSVTIGRQ